MPFFNELLDYFVFTGSNSFTKISLIKEQIVEVQWSGVGEQDILQE